jgi:DNA polymerase elongation subunit (family B)
MYNLRLQYPKSNPMNLIAKMLLNSPYGRFGMNDSFPSIEMVKTKEVFKFIDEFQGEIHDVVELGDKTMIVYRSTQADINTMVDGISESHNVSVPVAAAITAYARIHMSQFKNNENFNLYYTDTDSIYTDKPLPDYMISNKILGKMKLEYVLNKAIFLAPKVYYLETTDGRIIYKVKGLSH